MFEFLKSFFTNSKHGESLQHDAEERFRLMVEAVQDYAIFMLDAEGRVATWNTGAERIKGYKAAEIIGQHFSRFYPREQVDKGWPDHELRQATAEGRFEDEGWRVRKDGSQFWASVVITALYGKGRELRGFAKVTRDLTERQMTEEIARRALQEAAASRAMEKAAAEIERQRQQLQVTLSSIGDAVIVTDNVGVISFLNPAAVDLTGWTDVEAAGRPLEDVFRIIDESTRHTIENPVKRVLEEGVVVGLANHTLLVRRDGREIPIDDSGAPIRGQDNSISGVVLVFRDVTARAEEDRRKNEFIALLAHELRNPLAPLRNALQVLELAGPDQQVFDQVRVMMERQLQHLVRLVDDLLDVGRINQGKLHLRKERISLRTVISHSLEVCEALATEQGRQLTVRVPEEEIFFDADRTRLAQAVCNLVSNAVKYSEPGSRIWLSAWREDDEAVICVKDEGIGIAPPMIPKVFDLFMQADRSGASSQGGLGIGLTIVKRLMEMHGGTVEACSQGAGAGSEFFLRLPIARSAAPSTSQNDQINSFSHKVGRRVLVCDDNVDSAQSLAMLLKLLGHDVRIAHNGEEGLREAAEFHPDLSFLDIGMPGLDGYELCRRLRKESWGRESTIVALTGWGQEEDRRRSQDAGFDRHFVKPVEPVEIERLIAETDPS